MVHTRDLLLFIVSYFISGDIVLCDSNLNLFMLFVLQPDISKYSADILPLLFERLVYTSDSGKSSASITRTYYALETFCENLGNIATGLLDLKE